MKAPLIENVMNKSHAREVAIEWQEWQSDQSLSWQDVAEWNRYFSQVGGKFGLLEEFQENGIC